jgi:peptidoglycan/LPS O-acetylase OafA/YrhL
MQMGRDRLGHVPALAGVRGIAIALVLACHIGWLQGGALGVDLFFVLSGFLITSLLLEEHADTGRVSVRGFYRRRIARLAPALFFMLAFTTALAVGTTGRSALAHEAIMDVIAASYTTNVAVFLHPGAVPLYFRHLWSLAQEEQFYLLWPPLLIMLLPRLRRWLPVILGGAAAASMLELYLAPWSAARLYNGPDTHGSPIVMGCLAAVLWANGRQVPRRVGLAAFAVAAGIVWLATVNASYLFPPFAAVCALAIVYVVGDRMSLAARLLSVRPLVWLGGISYSLYLWHWVLLSVFGVSWLLLFPSVLIAWFSTRLVEEPFRRRRRPIPIAIAASPSAAA